MFGNDNCMPIRRPIGAVKKSRLALGNRLCGRLQGHSNVGGQLFERLKFQCFLRMTYDIIDSHNPCAVAVSAPVKGALSVHYHYAPISWLCLFCAASGGVGPARPLQAIQR
jgi:hypothetical protein